MKKKEIVVRGFKNSKRNISNMNIREEALLTHTQDLFLSSVRKKFSRSHVCNLQKEEKGEEFF